MFYILFIRSWSGVITNFCFFRLSSNWNTLSIFSKCSILCIIIVTRSRHFRCSLFYYILSLTRTNFISDSLIFDMSDILFIWSRSRVITNFGIIRFSSYYYTLTTFTKSFIFLIIIISWSWHFHHFLSGNKFLSLRTSKSLWLWFTSYHLIYLTVLSWSWILIILFIDFSSYYSCCSTLSESFNINLIIISRSW